MDAEEVNQDVMRAAWDNLDSFKPWKVTWDNWLLGWARQRSNSWLKWNWYEKPEVINPGDALEALLPQVADEPAHPKEQTETIHAVCNRWAKEGDTAMRQFAKIVHLITMNWAWVPPTGKDMQNLVGATPTQIYRLWDHFRTEVQFCETRR